LATGKAIRADDGAGLNIATVTFTEDAVTKHAQQVVQVDPTTPTQKAGVDANGNAQVIAASNSGVDIGDVTINNAAGASAVNIQDGGNSITVDGTVAATQSGTWTVQPGNTANTTAWKVDGSAVTNPVSIADGSDTTFGAKADAKSTATDSTAVSAMSVLKQISASVQAPPTQAVTQSGTWTVQPGNTANTTAWKVDASSVAVPITDNSGSLTVDNAGTFAVQEADGANVTLGSKADAKSTATDTTSITIMQVLKQISASVQAPPSQAVTNTGTFAVQASFGTATSGGYTTKHLVAGASTNATSVKASAGQIYGWSIYNNAAYPIYVKFHNTAGTPTAGSGVVQTVGVQAGTQVNVFNTQGIPFATGIGLTIVKDLADAGATAVAASDCVADVFYV
jgi:hypothetical protein